MLHYTYICLPSLLFVNYTNVLYFLNLTRVATVQFLSAPEDGGKKRPKHVEYYCSY